MARISTKYKPRLYASFAGLITARSEVSLERPEAQPFVEMDNLYCSSKGYITNEPSISRVSDEAGYVSHLRIFDSSKGLVVYAVRGASGTSLKCVGTGAVAENIWPSWATVTSCYFNSKLVLAAGQEFMYQFDGSAFVKITSKAIVGGKYVCQASNRLVVAGFPDDPYEIKISRVNNAEIYDTDEPVGEDSVLQAARLNVQNIINANEGIRGIATFESNKLVIFTSSSAVVYQTDPDYSGWIIDPTATIRYGCISHNSITAIGGDLFFCSASGIHSMRRSLLNGSTIFTSSTSEDITELYHELLDKTSNHADISAVFDPSSGRFHIFFPVNNLLAYRLSASLADARTEQDTTKMTWAMSSYGGLTCAEYLSTTALAGSTSGIQSIAPWYAADLARGGGYAKLPILWQENLLEPKRSLHLIFYASGSGSVKFIASDETGRELGTVVFDIPKANQIDYQGVPLQRQFIRPFSHEYRGLSLTMVFAPTSNIRVFAIGITTKE